MADARVGSRHAGRKRALDILYEADLTDRAIGVVLAKHLAAEDPPPDFAVALVRGVHRHRDDIDALLGASSRQWKLSRMPVLDRNILRIGVYELLHDDAVPTAVAIDEAVELAKELSTESSGRFVNGLLARAAQPPDAQAPTPAR